MEAQPTTEKRKVVVNLGGGRVVRGHVKTTPATDFEALLKQSEEKFPENLMLEQEDGSMAEIKVSEAKAVFFVKSFEGNFERHGFRFYAYGPFIRGIWVEILFNDNEVIEGIIENSINHIVDRGFLLSPSDPESNNELIYVNKAAMKQYRVLGLRTYEDT